MGSALIRYIRHCISIGIKWQLQNALTGPARLRLMRQLHGCDLVAAV
jgi:hypothetical protein